MADPNDPLERPRRFYKATGAAAVPGGWAVQLDGRTPKTPGGARLIAPTEALALMLAAEWDDQTEVIRAETMPGVRLANTAIDAVGKAREVTADEVARYAGSDLLCYRADGPGGLVEQEAAAWGPWLRWADEILGVQLHEAVGIIHRPQDAEALDRVRSLATGMGDFALAGLAHAVGLYGSAVLALAVQRGALSGAEAFDLSRLDEAFQERQWGVDEEAAERTARRREEAVMLDRWFAALR